MLSHRCAARVLASSAARPRILPGANALYTHHGPATALLRPALAPSPQRRTFIAEPLGNAFLAIHSFTGVPWWLLIPALSFVRTVAVNLPFHFLGNRQRSRQALISPLLTAWSVKVRLLKVRDPNAAYERQAKRIIREANLDSKALKFANVATTLASFAVCIRALQNMMGVTVADATVAGPVEPSLVTGGLLWFQDLTAADPHGILPVVLGVMISLRALPRSMAEVQLLLTPGADNTWTSGFRRLQLLLGPSLAVMLMNSPAGSVLFFIGTSASFLLTPRLNRYFNRYLPPVPANPWLHNTTQEPWFIEGPPTRK